MLLASLLLAGHLLPAALPAAAQAPPADTARLVRGQLNQVFAYGTLVLRDGQRLQGYLPVSALVLEGVVPYYAQAPDAQPPARPRLVSLGKVARMRVKDRYYEVMKPRWSGIRQLAERRQAGAAELFVAQAASPGPSFLGPAPVLASPHSAGLTPVEVTWYLRRPTGEAQPITAENFKKEVAAFLADDPELAAQVAAGAPGHQFGDLSALVERYNQRKAAPK